MLGSLARELGDPERITAWVRAFGMVNSAPGFASQPSVINGFSDLLLELFGEAGAHAPALIPDPAPREAPSAQRFRVRRLSVAGGRAGGLGR